MKFSDMTNEDFINYIILKNNEQEIIDECISYSGEAGQIFESLYKVVLMFHCIDKFQNYKILYGNFNNGGLKPLSFKKFLSQKLFNSKSSGAADIVLKKNNRFILFSCKYYNSVHSIDEYGIDEIVSVTSHKHSEYKEYQIGLCVKNAQEVLNKAKNSNTSSRRITKHITPESVLDISDLRKGFLKLKQYVSQTPNWKETLSTPKAQLFLHLHQHMTIEETYFQKIKNPSSSCCWGQKCRSGKSYMMAGYCAKFKRGNILVITPNPSETSEQYLDIFNNCQQLHNFNIYHVTDKTSLEEFVSKENNIIICSKQFIENYLHEKSLEKLKDLNFDVIFFDETHNGGTTPLSQDILSIYSCPTTQKIYLTATYSKPLATYNIPDDCKFLWDIEDEKLCKTLSSDDLSILRQKHPNIDKYIEYFITSGYTLEDISNIYKKMPSLCLMTTMFTPEHYKQIRSSINLNNSVYGFGFSTLFSINNNGEFIHKNIVKEFLRYISGSEKEKDYPKGDLSIFGRISKIPTKGYVQIWFLPSNNIATVSKNLKQLMLSNKILSKYSIECINRTEKDNVTDIKTHIDSLISAAKEEDKDGLILLAGNMISLGITIEECNTVMLMHDCTSMDKVVQQMFRCMTESKGKEYGIVVDFNIHRVLYTCSMLKPDMNFKNTIEYVTSNNLINIDKDMLDSKIINSEELMQRIIATWLTNPLHTVECLINKLKNKCVDFDSDTQKKINEYFIGQLSTNSIRLGVLLNESDDEQKLPSGSSRSSTEEIEEDEQRIKNINFTKEVLPVIIPFICVLNMSNEHSDLIKMINTIKGNTELLDIFNSYSSTLWKGIPQKECFNLINFIKKLIEENFNETTEVFNITLQIKLSLKALLEDSPALLDLLAKCLIPQTIEKRSFGEVFTPMWFIEKMLKDIETYWLKKYNENIWENEKLTWYDPAAGMGNFPIAIFYKLNEGLKNKIPNESKRHKHIIEKQLYMSELSKKNCFIIYQIFNVHGKYKLNLYQGDSLKINIYNTFEKDIFDICIGNPPYNKEFNGTSGASPLYHTFIEKHIECCKLLSFVTPSRWLSGGKGLGEFRETMLRNKNIVYMITFKDASEIFGKSVKIEGGVNYFMIDTDYTGLCLYNNTYIDLGIFDIILESKYHSLVLKILHFDKITKLYAGRCYGIETNDTRLSNEMKDGFIKCYIAQGKGFIKYIDKNSIKRSEVKKYKVVTARANGSKGEFGNSFIALPDEVHSGSYISFVVNSQQEAESLLSYIRCKLPNFYLSLRKKSQDISDSTCMWIPLPPLDKIWNDKDVYDYFGITENELKIIAKNTIETSSITNIEYPIIKDGRKKMYLIENKLYKVKMNKSVGEFVKDYVE